MAGRTFQIGRVWPGIAAAAFVALMTVGPLAAVVLRSDGPATFGPSDWAALRFTLWQALLSAVISVGLAVPVARALARRQFVGRGLLVTLLGAPFVLPVVVAVFALQSVFGQNGLVSDFLGWFGWPPVSIYGLQGVVLGHVFLNLPLATRVILMGWQAIPAEQFRLAAALGFSARDVARHLERPMLARVVPGLTVVIFILCTTSFAVALTLGGGPRATTVELAIYQAFRFDFDLGKAALLALVQFGICGLAAGLALMLPLPVFAGRGMDRRVERWDAASKRQIVVDAMLIAGATAFLVIPLASVVMLGAGGAPVTGPAIAAAGRSVGVAVGSASMTTALGLAIALSVAASSRVGRMTDLVGSFGIAVSPLAMGTGLFIMVFTVARPADWALPLTAVVNAVVSLPFALRLLIPAARDVEVRFGALADGLGLRGVARLRWLYLPRMRRPMGYAAGLAAALSVGDLGVITLFGDPDRPTLPLYMYRQMAAYHLNEAAGVAVVLLVLALAMFWLFERGGRIDADT